LDSEELMADTDVFASFLADFWNTGNVTDYRALLEDARYTLHRVNRTMARDRFHSIADSDNITIVMNHDRAEEAVVMMRGVVLAGLLDSVAQAAVRKARRSRPLIARLEGLKPVPAGHESVQIRYETGQPAHQLHLDVAPEPAAR
jgi:hypothetical protein